MMTSKFNNNVMKVVPFDGTNNDYSASKTSTKYDHNNRKSRALSAPEYNLSDQPSHDKNSKRFEYSHKHHHNDENGKSSRGGHSHSSGDGNRSHSTVDHLGGESTSKMELRHGRSRSHTYQLNEPNSNDISKKSPFTSSSPSHRHHHKQHSLYQNKEDSASPSRQSDSSLPTTSQKNNSPHKVMIQHGTSKDGRTPMRGGGSRVLSDEQMKKSGKSLGSHHSYDKLDTHSINSQSHKQPKNSGSGGTRDSTTMSRSRQGSIQGTLHFDHSNKRKKKTWFQRWMIYLGWYTPMIELTDPKAIEAVKMLQLTQKHLKKLRRKFDRIDVDGSGTIDADEFLESIGEPSTAFTKRLFSLIDVDDSGTIEFDEFIRVLTTFCIYSKDEILRFCFECFDLDGSGTIDENEFLLLCSAINNSSPTFPANYKKALEDFDQDHDGLIDYEEFIAIDKKFPMMLFPAFRLQDFMQKCTLGENEWLKINRNLAKRRAIEAYQKTHNGANPPKMALLGR